MRPDHGCLRWVSRSILAIALGFTSAHAALFNASPEGGSVVDRSALRDLATNRTAGVLTEVPLADGTRATFSLKPVEVFTSDARIVEFDGTTAREVGRPGDVALYHGTDLSSSARTITLAIGGDRVLGTVWEGDQPTTVLRSTTSDEMEVLDPRAFAEEPSADCAGPVSPPMQDGATAEAATGAMVPPVAALPPTTLAAEALVDVAYDMYHVAFDDNATDATNYVAFIIASTSELFRRDVGAVVLVDQVVLWTTPDPFAGVGLSAQIAAYRSWNTANRSGVARDFAFLLTAVNTGGGTAYVGTLCNDSFGYGLANLGTNPLGNGNARHVVAHEIGHLFGANHTHCYSPPLDRCANFEAGIGCYGGVQAQSVGETMSYCVTQDEGFRPFIAGIMRTTAEGASCIGAAPGTCGDGTVDAGEHCDDGNTDDGDCCSSVCVYDSTSTYCTTDGDPCTSDACDGAGNCEHLSLGACSACGAFLTLPPSGGTVSGSTSGGGTIGGTCGGAGSEVVYQWTPTASGPVTIDTCDSVIEDTVLYVRRNHCDIGDQLACNDDTGSCGVAGSRINLTVQAGTTYYIVVDAYFGDLASYTLNVTEPPCGNGVLDPDEQCDPASPSADGCCTSACVFNTFGASCTDDADPCTTDQCDGGGTCDHIPPGTCPIVCGDGLLVGPEECDDGDADPNDGCTNECTVCGNGVTTYPETCDDGNLSTNDGCTAGCRLACPSSPLGGCRLPTAPKKAIIQLKDKTPDTSDQLKWKWGSGALTPKADFGSPTTTDSYLLCVYDGAGFVVGSMAPAGGVCALKSCWQEKTKGFIYKDKELTPQGLLNLKLSEGLLPGKAKIGAKGKGGLLAMPALGGLTAPIRVQLSRPGGPCWESFHSAPFLKQDSTQLKDTSD